jgi:hypothetical protein
VREAEYLEYGSLALTEGSLLNLLTPNVVLERDISSVCFSAIKSKRTLKSDNLIGDHF